MQLARPLSSVPPLAEPPAGRRPQPRSEPGRYPAAPAAKGPSLALFLTEPARGALQFASLPLAAPWLGLAPAGDGHAVLVLPGLLATDSSTLALRRFLTRLGYSVGGWRLGRNLGPTDAIMSGMPRALAEVAERSGGPVSVVGWSLGGIFARELGREHPELVRQVITLGSPFALTDSRQSRAQRTFERRSHLHVPADRIPSREDLSHPIPVPVTAAYSKRDGIVAWRSCVETPGPNRQNVEVRCSHLGFGYDPATFWLVADRLAQPDGSWRPFVAPRLLRHLYPNHR
jgi:pimeloyl-ACP methyl ester carboxylesterase